jgi:hypothetical protein
LEKVGGHRYPPRSKNVLVLLKERFVRNDFFKGASGDNGGFFYDSWFHGNVNFDSGGDVGHFSLFKIIWGGDRVIEIVYIP